MVNDRFNMPRSLPNTADVFVLIMEHHRQVDADLVAVLSWPGTRNRQRQGDSMVE